MTKDKARLLNELFSVFTASKEDTEDNRKIIRLWETIVRNE